MRKSSKAVLWKNVQALMTHRFGKRNLTGFARHVGVGVATIQRIEEQKTSVGLDILDRIADKFGLTGAWQLLIPELDVTNPQMLAKDSAEMKMLAERIMRSTEAMTGILRASGNTEPAALDDPEPKR